jgi:putative peptidoglycan lipid II flippase
MSQMLKSSGAMAGATLTSRLLGMVREVVYGHFMGDGWVAAAFQVAFTIPNLFRRLLGEGALTAAFIPIFKEKEKTHGEVEMWRSANAVISGLIVSACIIIAIVMLGVTVTLSVHEFPARAELMLRLLRVMFPYMLLVCLAAAFMGMLNARGHFFIPAMGATMLNVVMIASVLWLAPRMGQELDQQVFALAIGVLVAGVAQAAFQLPTLRHEGFRYRWVSPWRDETVRRVVKKMIPGMIGLAAFQLNVTIIQGLGLWLDTPEQPLIAPFNYAVRLMELPQGMFGISLATFLLPMLSSLASDKNFGEFRSTLRHGLSTLLFMNLIASVLLVVLAEPIVRLIFEHGGKFGPAATERASYALMYLAPGLVAFSTVNILARAFFALGDTRTPMLISIACLVLNLVFTFILVGPFRQGGLGIANTASSAINVALLAYALRRKLKTLEMQALIRTLLPLTIAATAATLVAWQGVKFWESSLGHGTLILKFGAVFAPAAAAGLIYWLAAILFKIPAATEISDLILLKVRKK